MKLQFLSEFSHNNDACMDMEYCMWDILFQTCDGNFKEIKQNFDFSNEAEI